MYCDQVCDKLNTNICCVYCDNVECDSRCIRPENCKHFEKENEAEETALAEFQNKQLVVLEAIKATIEQKNELEAREKELKEKLQLAMEENGILNFQSDVLNITYVKPTQSERIDSATLKKKYPDIAKECTKTSNVKAYIKITLKGGNKT